MILVGSLDQSATKAVHTLINAATLTDGVGPLSEHAQLGLTNSTWTHVRALIPDDTIIGYAQLDADSTGELLVHPDHRERGVGRQLLDRLLGAGAARVWAHGNHPGAAALAASAGLFQVRSLWQMARALDDQLPEPHLPEGVTVRTFQPADDEADWLAVNAAAFADHPEQGRWEGQDLQQRMAELWFDPAGFFVAHRTGRMVGFHWTKVVGATGEVYIVGVEPAEQGTGLGKALTLIGLHHLHQLGLDRVTLYVDEANTPAVRLYQALGFIQIAADVQYAVAG